MEVYRGERIDYLAGVRVLGADLVLELGAVDVKLLAAGVQADERVLAIVRVVVGSVCITII